MRNDGVQIRIAELVENVAVRERVRLDGKIVVIGNPLRRRLRIVAARAIFLVDFVTDLLLIGGRKLGYLKEKLLPGFV